MFSPSVVEYSVIRAIIVTSADSCILSNCFNELIMETREALNELLFRVLKYSRGKSSISAANCMSQLITIIYEAKEIASSLRHELSLHYPRNFIKPLPFHKIITDIINPEISDLLVTMMNRKSSSFNTAYYAFSPPSLSPPTSMACPSSSSGCGSDSIHASQSSVHTFTAPQPIRPKTLGFCSKLPLTITKSIEEMLRPPGMSEDASIMNRPLARDWADGIRLTPVFNKDVVAQFFPELSGTPM
uniref:Transcription initiation factor TFIID subunit 8 n=1 Tax=Heterorhabditis bacteriophora TaxID=37862 RepID=A0A1I7WN48_HETBA